VATASGGRWTEEVAVTGAVDSVEMTGSLLVYLPRGYAAPGDVSSTVGGAGGASAKAPLVLVLHGWNDSPQKVRDQGDLARWADRYGLVLAVPAMGKTIYESQWYPRSRKWAKVPGLRWVGEVILPYVRAHYAVARDRGHTAVIGYSTGGRGAVLLAEQAPEFAFVGSLSGTFDLMRLAEDTGEYRIHRVVYGPRSTYGARWQRDNCVAPARLAALRGTRLYIGHGEADAVVPVDQLEALRAVLAPRAGGVAGADAAGCIAGADAAGRIAGADAAGRVDGADTAGRVDGGDVSATFVVTPNAGHNWAYWNGQWGAMFEALADALGVSAGRDAAAGSPP
jgi:S-formylglutathione hydrolase FrmB